MKLLCKDEDHSLGSSDRLHENEISASKIEITQSQPESYLIYKSKMGSVQIRPYQDLLVSLANEGVQFQHKNEKDDRLPSIQKFCLKTDWQSTIYQYKIKSLKTKLKILRVNMQIDTLVRNGVILGKGRFGKVLKFVNQKGIYALKCIQISNFSQQKLTLILSEVIIGKFASILKAGPKFQNIFGYDSIVFLDGIMFSMECCQQIKIRGNEDIEKLHADILSCLKIMHSFRICHLDMKESNIAWSKEFQSYVLIDFGFARFVKEAGGHKSLIQYTGTLKYSSPEMKKLYFLKTPGLVDLYYNDLYGLEITVSEFQDQLRHSQSIKLDLMKYFSEQNNSYSSSEQQKNETADFYQLNQYFLYRFNLFMDKFDEAGQIIEKSKGSFETLKKLTIVEIEKRKGVQFVTKKLVNLKQNIQRLAAKSKNISNMDSLLLDYTFRVSSNAYGISPFQKLKSISQAKNSVQLLQGLWLDFDWMVQIFNFLDVYFPHQGNLSFERNMMVNSLHKLIFGEKAQKSATMKMRDVLLYFFEYFEQKGCFLSMIKVQCYLLLMDDIYELDCKEQKTLKLLKQKSSAVQYLNYNMQFFFAKLLLTDKADFVSESDNEQNLVQLKSEFTNGTFLFQLIHDSIGIIELSKGRYSLLWVVNKNKEKYQQFAAKYLLKYKDFIRRDVQELIHYYAQVQNNLYREYNYQNIRNLRLDSFYLRCAISKFMLCTYIQQDKTYQIRNLMKKQAFLKQFQTFEHIFGNQLSSEEIKSLCIDFTAIIGNHRFQLNQSSLLVLYKNAEQKEFSKFLINYMDQIKVYNRSENNKKQLGSIYRILSSLAEIPNEKVQNESFQSLNRFPDFDRGLNKIRRFYEEISSMIYSGSDQALEINYRIQLNEALVRIIEKKFDIASEMLMKLNEGYSEIVPISYLMKIFSSRQIQGRLKDKIQNVLYNYLTRAIGSRRFEVFYFCPQLLSTMVRKLYLNKGLQITYETLKQILAFLEKQNRLDLHIYWFSIFRNLFQVINEDHAKVSLIKKIAFSEKLQNFVHFYIILILILKILASLPNETADLQIRERILKICVFFSNKFFKGIFRTFNTMLHINCFKLLNKTNRKCIRTNFWNKVAVKKALDKIKQKERKQKKSFVSIVYTKMTQKLFILYKNIDYL